MNHLKKIMKKKEINEEGKNENIFLNKKRKPLNYKEKCHINKKINEILDYPENQENDFTLFDQMTLKIVESQIPFFWKKPLLFQYLKVKETKEDFVSMCRLLGIRPDDEGEKEVEDEKEEGENKDKEKEP